MDGMVSFVDHWPVRKHPQGWQGMELMNIGTFLFFNMATGMFDRAALPPQKKNCKPN